MRFEKVFAIGVALVCTVSCADDDFDDDDDAVATVDGAYALDAADAANWDTATMYAATDSIDDPFFLADRAGTSEARTKSIDPERAAKTAADSADQYFSPASCVDATADGNEVMYELSSCKGPLGLASVNGTIHVAFSEPDESDDAGVANDDADAGVGAGLAFDVSSHNLTINGAAAELNANGTYSRDPSGDKVIVVHSRGEHARNGAGVKRDVMTHAHWKAGSQCVEVDLDGTITALGQSFDVVADDFTRCKDQCPKSGSVRIVGKRTITLTFDGTDQPEFTTSSGRSGTIDLDCD